MAIVENKRYKISINPDSSKLQGLRIGDIVRRQYFDGNNIIYSLMCVEEVGTTNIPSGESGFVEQHWFIGMLLDGVAPNNGELLDFVRITNLFDVNRSGALYLTASDSESPFMDVIDGIGKNCSLSWPSGVCTDDLYQDSKSQYCITGSSASYDYFDTIDERTRSIRFVSNGDVCGIKQTFYEYLNNFKSVNELSIKDQIVVSYWVKVNQGTCTASVILGYDDQSRIDGITDISITSEWQYKLNVISVDNSGRHLRALKIDIQSTAGQEIYIADLNIIRLSNLVTYGDASQIRLGKLSGLTDPVFGRLEGYGSYLQKLYASSSAHISGTLTAGDENGFASTFYAGKIHKNAFVNSINPVVSNATVVNLETENILNPTGIGDILHCNPSGTYILAQTNEWLSGEIDGTPKVGQRYTFSFWANVTTECVLSICQDKTVLANISINIQDTRKWIRHKVTFDISEPTEGGLILLIKPSFQTISDEDTEAKKLYITAPQLEAGAQVTQYQPTDSTLNYCNEYGAWFSRGGIGGTIQNPILRLNFDGEGEVSSRNNTFRINPDGSGHIGNGKIRWHKNGGVELDSSVKIKWDNLSSETQEQISSTGIKILGGDTFMRMGDRSSDNCISIPNTLTLTAETDSSIEDPDIKWYAQKSDNSYELIAEGTELSVSPTANYWPEDDAPLPIKCVMSHNEKEFIDIITIKNIYIGGYSIEVVSKKGASFKNQRCKTKLIANVFYQGKLVDSEYIKNNFILQWSKYHLPDIDTPVIGWWEAHYDSEGEYHSEIDRFGTEIEVDYDLDGQDLYMCELMTKGEGFTYSWPIIFAK